MIGNRFGRRGFVSGWWTLFGCGSPHWQAPAFASSNCITLDCFLCMRGVSSEGGLVSTLAPDLNDSHRTNLFVPPTLLGDQGQLTTPAGGNILLEI